MTGLIESKLKTKAYSLKNFVNPKSILRRLVQSERRRLRLPNGIAYLRLLSSLQPEGSSTHEALIYISEVSLEKCSHDVTRMCL
jgi:hypothetical protein